MPNTVLVFDSAGLLVPNATQGITNSVDNVVAYAIANPGDVQMAIGETALGLQTGLDGYNAVQSNNGQQVVDFTTEFVIGDLLGTLFGPAFGYAWGIGATGGTLAVGTVAAAAYGVLRDKSREV